MEPASQKYPFEVGFAEAQANLDSYVTRVFSTLKSEFLVLPKGTSPRSWERSRGSRSRVRVCAGCCAPRGSARRASGARASIGNDVSARRRPG